MSILGLTRSVVRPDHALVTAESHVAAPLPGWTAAQGVVLVSPRMGARFSQTIVDMEMGAASGPPLPGVERFVWVLKGRIRLAVGHEEHDLGPAGYALLPADAPHRIAARELSRLLLVEKPYVPLAAVAPPGHVVGRESDVHGTPLEGDPDIEVRLLVPEAHAFDLAVNTMAYVPGAALPFVEVHVMEHGLWMLEGRGVYRLSDAWYPVGPGDAIWMAPHCPQWFCAYGREPAKYLIYKDWNRDPLTAA
jgi:(S)-ureidoglycine aminohydrolase